MIEQCDGYLKLRDAIMADTKSGRAEEERLKKLSFAVERAIHYEERTGVSASEILTAWESQSRGIKVDIWIDDAPYALVHGH